MAFKHYLEEEDDKPYFTTNSLGYYYDKMEGFAEKVEGSAKALNLTKEEIEQRIALRLQEWDGKLKGFDSSVETLLTEWVDDGTLTHVIDSTLIEQKIAPVAQQLGDTVLLLSTYKRQNNETDDSGRLVRAIDELKGGKRKRLFIDERELTITKHILISNLSNFTIYSNGCVCNVSKENENPYTLDFTNCSNGVIEGLKIVGNVNALPSRPFRLFNSTDIQVINCSVENTMDHGFTLSGTLTENITFNKCKAKNLKWHGFGHTNAPNIPKGNIKYLECEVENTGYDFLNPSKRLSDGMAFDVHNSVNPVWVEKCIMTNCVQMGKNSSGSGDVYWLDNRFTQDNSIDFSLTAPPLLQVGNPLGNSGHVFNNIVILSVQTNYTLFITYGNAKIKGNIIKQVNPTIFNTSILQTKESDFCVFEDNKVTGFNVNANVNGSVVFITGAMKELIFKNNVIDKIQNLITSGRSMVTSFYINSYLKIDKIVFDGNTISGISGSGVGNYYVVTANPIKRLSVVDNDFNNQTSFAIKPISGGVPNISDYQNNDNLDVGTV